MKKTALALAAALLISCACPACAMLRAWDESVYVRGVTGTTADGWEYDVNPLTGTAAIVGYAGHGTDVTVPAAVNGYAVDVLFDGACTEDMTRIALADGIRCIGPWAFSQCAALESVIIPVSVTDIDARSFDEAKNDLIVYGYSGSAAEAFADEKGYVFVAVDRGESASRGSFGDFRYIEKNGEAHLTGYDGQDAAVTLPNAVNGTAVTAIGCGSFRNASFTSVTVPQGITAIGAMAFFNCTELTAIDLPTSLRSIGEAGLSCCDALASLTLPEGLVSLGPDALAQCSSLTYLKLPSTLREAAHGALSYLPCAAVELPEGMAEISNWLLFGAQITRVTLPGSVTRIGEGAFVYCESLAQAVIPKTVSSIEDTAFADAYYGYFPQRLTICGYRGSEAERYANAKGIPFAALDAANVRAVLPAGLTALDSLALSNTAVEAVYVNADCTVIRDRAFEYCGALREVHVAGMNTAIEKDAFFGCPGPVLIYAPAGSAAVRFADEHGYAWMPEN